jgi:hypothetical protein
MSTLKKQIPPGVCICLLLLQSALFALPDAAVASYASRPAPQRGPEVFITDVELARDDGAGGYGQVVKNFRRSDNPIHCVVTLSRAEEGTRVRFVWTAVAAGGKSEETLASTEVVTRAREIVADGKLRLPREWPAGRYRVQATVNKSTKTVEFSIS